MLTKISWARASLLVLFVIVAVLAGFFFGVSGHIPQTAAAFGMPFGGNISSVRPCNYGVLVQLKGRPYSGPLMWLPTTKGYLYNKSAPPRVGQNVLGMASGNAQCFIGRFYVGGGPAIQFYGSSR